jgi:hypothetical protein
MPANTKRQFKYIWAMRRKYKSKKKAPKNMRWVFDSDWTSGLKYNDLPTSVIESKIDRFFEFVQRLG